MRSAFFFDVSDLSSKHFSQCKRTSSHHSSLSSVALPITQSFVTTGFLTTLPLGKASTLASNSLRAFCAFFLKTLLFTGSRHRAATLANSLISSGTMNLFLFLDANVVALTSVTAPSSLACKASRPLTSLASQLRDPSGQRHSSLNFLSSSAETGVQPFFPPPHSYLPPLNLHNHRKMVPSGNSGLDGVVEEQECVGHDMGPAEHFLPSTHSITEVSLGIHVNTTPKMP